MADIPSTAELAKRTYLKPAQMREVKSRIQAGEDALRAHAQLSNVYGIDVNVEETQRFLEMDKKTLELGSPPELPGHVKNKLFKEMKRLEGEMKHDMPTHDDQERPLPVNIDRHMAWEKAHKKHGLAWKSIRRILAGGADEGPNFTNVESFRSNTPPKGDPRKFWRGFDDVKWEEEVTEEFVSSISDSEYLTFLELMTLKWTRLTICKKLNWTKEQYSAACERFRRSGHATDADASRIFGEIDADDEVVEQPKVVEAPLPVVETKISADVGAGKIPIMLRDAWPIPEMRARGLRPAWLKTAANVPPVRLTQVCANPNSRGWKEQERVDIQAALDAFDRASASKELVGASGGIE